MSKAQSMHDMPVRELIAAIREKTADETMPILHTMLLNVLCHRIEQEADRADAVSEALCDMWEYLSGNFVEDKIKQEHFLEIYPNHKEAIDNAIPLIRTMRTKKDIEELF